MLRRGECSRCPEDALMDKLGYVGPVEVAHALDGQAAPIRLSRAQIYSKKGRKWGGRAAPGERCLGPFKRNPKAPKMRVP